MDPFPRDPMVWADHPGYGCNLPALFSAHWHPNPELGFRGLRCVDDVALRHRAGVRWRAPVAVSALRLSWSSGYVPTELKVLVERSGTEVPLDIQLDPDTLTLEIPIEGGPIEGVVIEQPPGSGSAAHPGVMRLLGLAILPQSPASPLITLLGSDGQRHTPHMHLASDGDPWTCLELSDSAEIEIRTASPTTIAAVALDLVRIGGLGTPTSLHPWLSRPDLLRLPGPTPDTWLTAPEGPRWLDTTHTGIVAGTTRVVIGLPQPTSTDRIRLQMPLPTGALIAATHAALLPTHPTTPPISPKAQGPRPKAPKEPLRYSASLGVPGTEARAGVDPQGGVMIQPGTLAPHAGSHAQCLHLRARLDPAPTGPLRREVLEDTPALSLTRDHGPLAVSQRLYAAPTNEGPPALQWWMSFSNTGGSPVRAVVEVGIALRDYLWALPLDLKASAGGGELVLRWPDGSVAVQALGSWRLKIPKDSRAEWVLETEIDVGPGEVVERGLCCPLGGLRVSPLGLDAGQGEGLESLKAVTRGFLEGAASVTLPDPAWEAVLRGLLVQSTLFAQAEGQVRYGIFPSVYHGDVFGLEEDWLFYGWALWGLGHRALEAFEATYLNEAHLSKGHYLHDLRNGLTPWQAERLIRLQGLGWEEAFGPEVLALLEGLGDWTVAQRRSTVGVGDESGAGWRVFPGLLPAYRYGGDLGFETQSLSANVANFVGLRALASAGLFEAGWADEVEAYRTAIMEAFEGVKQPGEPPFYPMHTGGGDPGSYYQLFAAGILEPMDFFAADDPRPAAMDAAMESQDRLFGGLPRFDDWGSPGPGLDAHYCVGYLLRALQTGRRAVFQEGLSGLFAHASDPEVGTFREVSPLQLGAPAWGHDVMIPGRRMGRSDPCVGGVGVGLMLIRCAIVMELAEADGRLGRRLRLLAGTWSDWWSMDRPLSLTEAPTFAGPVSLRVERVSEDVIEVDIDAPGAESVELCIPVPTGRRVQGVETASTPLQVDDRGIVALALGRHRLRITHR